MKNYCDHENYISEDYEPIDEDIEDIEWDDIEKHYIDSKGNMYRCIQSIPVEYLHLVKHIKPIKSIKLLRIPKKKSNIKM